MPPKGKKNISSRHSSCSNTRINQVNMQKPTTQKAQQISAIEVGYHMNYDIYMKIEALKQRKQKLVQRLIKVKQELIKNRREESKTVNKLIRNYSIGDVDDARIYEADYINYFKPQNQEQENWDVEIGQIPQKDIDITDVILLKSAHLVSRDETNKTDIINSGQKTDCEGEHKSCD